MQCSRAWFVGLALATLVLPIGGAAANDGIVLPVKLSLPVNVVVGNQIVTRTLKEKDIVNLALGRPLGSKVDKKTEILAAVISYNQGFTRAVVFNPSQNGLAQFTTTVFEPTPMNYDVETAYLGRSGAGQGVASGTVVATSVGSPALNGLLSSTLWSGGGGKATGPPAIFGTPKVSASVKGVVAGRLRFTVTENGQTQTLAGFIVNGKGKVSGPLLGVFDDGNVVGCGDGIVQPELGEECEFFGDPQCPGHCEDCLCEACGNNRTDEGEICDGSDDAVCAGQVPPRPCRADCQGCQF